MASKAKFCPPKTFRCFAAALLGFLVGNARAEEASILDDATLSKEGIWHTILGDNHLFNLNFKTP